MSKSRITVLLADDHDIVREGLRALLELEDDIEVVAEAENGRQAVDLTLKLSPAVIVMDIGMPLLNGLEATRQILHASPEAKVLMLSAHNEDSYVERALAHGASGYLIKQTAAQVLPAAIRKVHQGTSVFSPLISNRLNRRQQKAPDRVARLSSREMEVLQLVAEGNANKEMAEELQINIKTVEKHRQSLMEKLDIHDTAGLTRYAIANGIIENSVQVTIIPS